MAKKHAAVGKIHREKGFSYYVDGDGTVRKFKMRRTGAKKGHRTCTAPKRTSRGRRTRR
jgi:hypothetical protein